MTKKDNCLKLPELIILKSLQLVDSRFGLEIRSAIDTEFAQKLSFSSLYPKLELLEAKGLIELEQVSETEVKASPNRKYYKLTPSGHQLLKQWEYAFNNLPDYVVLE